MTTTTRGLGDESPPQGDGQILEAEPATEPLIGVSVAADKCAVCGAEVAPDQRYCVECGTRRGAPRFAANLPSSSASAPATARRSTSRPSTMLVLLAIATVLLAFGVGILVGHDALSKAPTVNVHVSGAGSTGGSSAGSGGSNSSGTNSSTSGGSSGSGSSSSSGSQPTTPKITFH